MTDGRQQIPVTPQHIRLPRDSTSGALITVANSTRRIFDGNMFTCTHIEIVANNNSATVHIVTPATPTVYLTGHIASIGLSRYFFYENPTTSNNGTELAEYNRDRNSSATPAVALYHTPTVSDTGTLIQSGYLGAKGAMGERMEDNEWILKPSEQYLLRLTNLSGTNNYYTITLDWYEV